MNRTILYWVQLASHREVDISSPTTENISIEDIASALSKICRYGAQSCWYSVAAHSVAMARFAVRTCRSIVLPCLFHDASEAYLGDSISPVRRFVSQCPTRTKECLVSDEPIPNGPLEYLHTMWSRAIEEKFGVVCSPEDRVKVDFFDNLALQAEIPLVYDYVGKFWYEQGIIHLRPSLPMSCLVDMMTDEVQTAMNCESDGSSSGRKAIMKEFIDIWCSLTSAS